MSVFAIKHLDHVVLRVADIARAKAFYEGVLGCREARWNEQYGISHLSAGTALIDLIQLDGPLGRLGGRGAGAEGRNLEHFCIRIEPFDPAAIRAHLNAHGVAPDRVEERFGADGIGPSMYIRDPDGNVVELKGPPGKAA
jgi:catechol 2,3-dioxygenase-like lactoylglutathione lyase family enzyme